MKLSKTVLLGLITILITYQNCGGFKSFKPEISSSSFATPDSIIPSLFKVERNAVRILPYDVCISKLKSLVASDDAALYAKLESKKIELGSYDFAKGVSQDLTWIDSRLSSWTQSLQPYCASQILRAKFPFPASAKVFIETALGRDLNSDDQSTIDEITAAPVSNDVRLEMLCYVTLSSLEFVAK